jgi:hypothetical protein
MAVRSTFTQIRGYLARAIIRIRLRMWKASATTRLSAHMKRDVGLLPYEVPNDSLWGYGGIMWRP